MKIWNKLKKIDQRIILTQTLLKNALIQLMQEQHISKISVRSICEVADINRSTFYVHFTDQYDLLDTLKKEVLANLNIYLEKQDFNHLKPLSVQVLTRILDYFKDNVYLFKALLSENCDFTFQKDILDLAQVISSQSDQHLNPIIQRYVEIYCLTGAINMLHKWLHDGLKEISAQMAEFIVQILLYGITNIEKDIFS